MGACPGHKIYKELLDAYATLNFKNKDGSLNITTVVKYTSKILFEHGLNNNNNEPQCIDGIWIYPPDVFCPMDHTMGNKTTITDRTVSVHLYDCSWIDHSTIHWKLHKIKIFLVKHTNAEFVESILKKLR